MTPTALDASPFADDVRAVALRYGVPERDVIPVPAQGQVNVMVFLGSELVLRLPRTDRAAGLLAKEAEIIPLVRAAGVPTPALVSYDTTLGIASVPYAVHERLHDATLAERSLDPVELRRAHASVGEILVTLHALRRGEVGAVAALPEPYAFSSDEVLDDLREAGEIGCTQREWLSGRFEALRPDGPALDDPVLIHRDVSPSNVMVDANGRVSALLDWGQAEWGSRARDLVGLPIRALPDLVAGYRSALGTAGPDDDLSLERDALWYHLYLALTRLLKQPSTSDERNWAAPRSATLIDLLAFVSDAGAEAWPELLRRRASE